MNYNFYAHKSLTPYIDRYSKGLINLMLSPCERLILFNYSDKCVYDSAWDEYTLKSRGIIFERETGNPIARPFSKFFNLGERLAPTMAEIKKMSDDGEPCIIQEKIDGSLGIVYYYDHDWHVATRGSFTSDQATKGKEILNKYDYKSYFNKDMTYLFEIIYPGNRVVVDYHGEEKLVLLVAIWTQNGLPAPEKYSHPFQVPEHYKDLTVDEAIKKCSSLTKDQEGFVVFWPRKDLRVKIKGHEYVRVHKIISNLSPLSLWEVMSNGKVPTEYMQHIPEEYREEMERIKESLENSYYKIYQESMHDISTLESTTDYRAIGIYIKSHPERIKHPSLIFPILKNKNYDQYIMDMIRPTANNIKETNEL